MAGVAVGIDWHKRGWVAVALGGSPSPSVLVGADLFALIGRVPEAECIAVDMPIGVPRRTRAADSMAREYVGPRRNSVFMTPPAAVLRAGSYVEANAIATTLIQKKISQQAWALRNNIEIVAAVAKADPRLIEVHPEVSFTAMAKAAIPYPKTAWNGQHLRRQLLDDAGTSLPDQLPEGGDVPAPDILDAAAAAWSARRYLQGEAQSFPKDASPGQREVIWY